MFGDIVYTHCPKGRRRGPCAPPPVIGNPSIHRCRGAGSAPPEPAGVDAGRRGRRPLQTTTENPPVPCRAGPMSVHRRASRLSAADASDSRGTSSKSPRFIRRRRRFGDSLPTVVPAGCWPLSRPTAGALPRNRLASSATGGASAISPKFPLPAQKGRTDRWPVRPQVRRKMVRKKQYYSSMASSHTAPMAVPPNRAASHGDIRSRRRGGAPWVRA